jgi:hypothetical protein
VSRNTILNCGGGISVGPPRQPDLASDAVSCASSAANPICFRVAGGLIANNLVLNVRGAGLRLAGTSGVEVLHNSFLRCGLAVSAGVELAALQLWDSTTAAGQLIQNANVQLMNNLIVTAPLSAQPALSITSQQPWSGGASVPGVAWASASLQNNLMYKDPSSEPVSYASLFYSMNSNIGAAANSGFGSLSVGSSVPYVLDTGLPWPHRYSVASWNTQRSVSNAVGNPGLDAAYTPGAGQLAGPGSADAAACSSVNEAVDLLGRPRACNAACIGALESIAAVPAPAYASAALDVPSSVSSC